LAKIEALDIMGHLSALKPGLSGDDSSLERHFQEQATAIAQIQERLLSLEGLEVENQLLEVLQLHLRLYKWQQELTAEINQRLTPVVAEMQLGKQRQLELESKITALNINRSNGNGNGNGKTPHLQEN
jgi:hypothetical protein